MNRGYHVVMKTLCRRRTVKSADKIRWWYSTYDRDFYGPPDPDDDVVTEELPVLSAEF
jgi:hypothetical protein